MSLYHFMRICSNVKHAYGECDKSKATYEWNIECEVFLESCIVIDQ